MVANTVAYASKAICFAEQAGRPWFLYLNKIMKLFLDSRAFCVNESALNSQNILFREHPAHSNNLVFIASAYATTFALVFVKSNHPIPHRYKVATASAFYKSCISHAIQTGSIFLYIPAAC